MVVYNWSNVNVEVKWKPNTYNYAEWDFYEVARLKVTAGNTPVDVNWFSFTNNPELTKLDLSDFADDVRVVANGEEVKHVSFNAKKSDFDVTFDPITIEGKKNAESCICDACLEEKMQKE